MTQLIDYAGLFPPAALDMDTAVRQYAAHRSQPESWMLGRFISPAGRLDELADSAEDYISPGKTWRVSALLGDRENADRALAVLPGQCGQIRDFEKKLSGRALVQVLEVPLPADLSVDGFGAFLSGYLDCLEESGARGRELFLEIPDGTSREEELPMLESLAMAAEARSGADGAVLRLGAKLRCGGVTAEAFPSVQRIARIVAHCRDLQLPLKCTAGLHHPVRHQSTEPDVLMHGFLNVFGAGLLAHSKGWNAEETARVVAETEASAFIFAADSFSWRGHQVPLDTVRALRTQFLCGFGSCSFDEPRDDLQSLGLL